MENLRFFLAFIFSCLLLVGCGGGGSNSGPSSAPQVVSDILPGVYSGERSILLTINGTEQSPGEGGISLTVTGSLEGQQQVIIAFAQFSGSSAIIEPSNTFSIPSGTFSSGIGSLGNCEISVVYEGTFMGNTVSGEGNSTWVCENVNGTITAVETFTATLEEGAAKALINEFALPNIY